MILTIALVAYFLALVIVCLVDPCNLAGGDDDSA